MRVLFDVSALFRDRRVESGVPTYTLSLIKIFQKLSSQTEERLPRRSDQIETPRNDKLEVMFFYSGYKSFGLETYIPEYVHLPIPNKIVQLLTFCGVRFDWLIEKFGRWRGDGNSKSSFRAKRSEVEKSHGDWSRPYDEISPLGSRLGRDDNRGGAVFDIFFTPNVSTFYRYFSKKIKVVGVVHDLSHILFPELKPFRERWKYAGQSKTHIIERLAFWNRNRKPIFERFDQLVAISEHTKKDLVKFLKIPEEKIVVIYPTFQNQLTVNSQQLTEELFRKFKIIRPYVMFLGHIEPRKNVENLLRAFSLLKQALTHPPTQRLRRTGAEQKADSHGRLEKLQLVVAGRQGYQFGRLLHFAKAHGLTFQNFQTEDQSSQISNFQFLISKQLPNPKSQISNGSDDIDTTHYSLASIRRRSGLPTTHYFDVIFTGPVSEEEKCMLMRNAEVFVYPSLYEGFAYPCLEAMSVGTSVVTSPVSALPEVLGDAVLYTNPWRPEMIAKVVEEVLHDQNLRDDLVQKGKKQIEKFQNFETQVHLWIELLKKI